MTRVKRGKAHLKRRKNLLAKTKSFRWGRKNLIKKAKVAATKAGAHAQRSRRQKKRDARALWNIKINAAAREHGLTYGRFISALKKKGVMLDRKVLSQIAENHPEVFQKIVESVK